jgi:uncharacterized membrane protein
MQGLGTQPDNYTFHVVWKVCSNLLAFQEGNDIHNHIISTKFELNVSVGTILRKVITNVGIWVIVLSDIGFSLHLKSILSCVDGFKFA